MRRLLFSLLLACLPITGFADVPQRIITLGSAITETTYALGEGSRLVAIDSTSQYPAAARQLPDVGYLRTLGAEGILSMQPDLIIASHEAGPPQVIEQLRKSGVAVEIVDTGPGHEHALLAMQRVGDLLGKPHAARVLVEKNRALLAQVKAAHANTPRPQVLFVLGGHGAQATIGGSDTKANTMIELAMAHNVASSFTSYKPGSPEALLNMQPDVIVAASHGIDSLGGVEQMLKRTGLALTPAGQHGRVIVMDTVYLLGMGPRMGEAAAQLAEKIRQAGTEG